MKGWQRGHCSILIYSDFISIDEISGIMRIQPTKSICKGELISKRLNTYAPHNGWFYDQEFHDLNDIDHTMQSVAEICINVLDDLKKTKHLDLHLRCFVNSDLAQVGYSLSPETISLLSQIGQGLEITLFSWGGAEDE